MPREIDASPPPSAHLATLARMGYSFNAAISDILDNSIAAGSSTVEIALLRYDGKYRLTIVDDGCGMTGENLLQNMVIGCKDPSIDRGLDDLGRFGAGQRSLL